jgi:hypothetical protein
MNNWEINSGMIESKGQLNHNDDSDSSLTAAGQEMYLFSERPQRLSAGYPVIAARR